MNPKTIISILTTLLILTILSTSISYALHQNINTKSINGIIKEIYAVKYFEEVIERDDSFALDSSELHAKILQDCSGKQTINLAQTDTPLDCKIFRNASQEETTKKIYEAIISSEESEILKQSEKNPINKIIPYTLWILIISVILTIFLASTIAYLSNPKLKSLKTLGLTFLITGLVAIITSGIPINNSKLGNFGNSIISKITSTIDNSFLFLGLLGLIFTTSYFIIRFIQKKDENQNPYKPLSSP